MLNYSLFFCANLESQQTTEEEYLKSVETMKETWEKDKEGTKALLALTYINRRDWINGKSDSVAEILSKFPCFRNYDFVSFLSLYCLRHAILDIIIYFAGLAGV